MPEVADLSYERLAAIRTAARQLLDSGVLFIHEQTHLTEIIGRVDAAVRLKRDRETGKHDGKPARAGPR